MGLAAVAALFAMSACSNNNSRNSGKETDDDMVYTGLLPAADTSGVRYTLSLDYDDDKNNSEGDYYLVETYLAKDSTSNETSFKSEGDFTVEQKEGAKYLRLTADAKDSSAGASRNLYFRVDSDSTLTMVNDSLEPSANPNLNYTLKLIR